MATTWGGLAVGFNLYHGGKRSEAADRSSEAATRNSEAATRNAKAAEEGQITERFTQAIQQLGNEKIEIRIGGIYTLERIAQNSPQDHWTVMETLSAFIRENAPFQPSNEESNTNNQNSESEQSKPRTDIQAAFTVIGRRNHKQDPPSKCINLSYSNLQGSDCSNSYLNNAIFFGSNLEQTNFEKAKLKGANFGNACLNKATLGNTELQEAHFGYAELHTANFAGSNLQGAFFGQAQLKDTIFRDAELQGAELRPAKNIIQEEIEQAYGDESTRLPNNLQRPEHWKASKENNASDEETEEQN